MDDTAEILQAFLEETREHLSTIEPDLLEMEHQGRDVSKELVNRVFRAIHSTKGGAAFLALEAVTNLSHAMESVLMLMRDGKLIPAAGNVDALLRGVDVLRTMIEDLQHSADVSCATELRALHAILEAEPAEAAPAPRPASSGPACPGPEGTRRPLAEAAPVASAQGGDPLAGSRDTLRVRVELLDRLMGVAGELVLGRNQLLRAVRGGKEPCPGLEVILQHVDRITTELQSVVMQTRIQPVGTLFRRFPRVVRDLARSLGKRITLRTEGEDVELDRSVIEILSDPLLHLIRNSVDHAMEPPEERLALGKSPDGVISLVASRGRGQVSIVVTDDGRGISRQGVLDNALRLGIVDRRAASELTDREVLGLVFAPGFSTAAEVSALSGRGVGMDVVRANVESLGGVVSIESEEGLGTVVTLCLPLSVAVVPALVVGVAGHRFAVPQASIEEFVWVGVEQGRDLIESVQGQAVLRLRERLLPLIRLDEALAIDRAASESSGEPVLATEARANPRRAEQAGTREQGKDSYVLVLRNHTDQFGLVVDELLDPEDIVLKPLPGLLAQVPCFSGSTILGDGRVTMILDPDGLGRLAGLCCGAQSYGETRTPAERPGDDAQGTRPVILFNSAPGEVFAVPQERVLRLERIARYQLRALGSHEFVDYHGRGLRVLRLDAHFPVTRVPADAEEFFLVIPKDPLAAPGEPARVGILACSILDAREVSVKLQPPLFGGPGMQGAAMIDGHLTVFIDPVDLARQAELL